MVFLRLFFEKVDFEKKQQTTEKQEKYPVGKELDLDLAKRSKKNNKSLNASFVCFGPRLMYFNQSFYKISLTRCQFQFIHCFRQKWFIL